MNILVTGGAGYIGSIAVKKLLDEGHSVVVVDNMSKGVKRLVPDSVKLYEVDTTSPDLKKVFSENEFDTVIHFAAYKAVEESVADPIKYSDNIKGVINVLDCMKEFNVKRIIFSSTAAVYGDPEYSPVDEKHKTEPTNYYGFTKLAAEGVIKWYSNAYGIDYVILRYFNVAGDGGLEYIDPDAKNLMPIIMEFVTGKRSKLTVYGDDWDTKDGTCVRDYVHVIDLVNAHVMALNWPSGVVNIGSGEGYTVVEVINAFEEVLGDKIEYILGPRRDGDYTKITASNSKAKSLGWEPKYSLKEMAESTVKSYKNN